MVCPVGIGLHELKLSAGEVITTTRWLLLALIGMELMKVPWRLRLVETVKHFVPLRTVNLLSLVLG